MDLELGVNDRPIHQAEGSVVDGSEQASTYVQAPLEEQVRPSAGSGVFLQHPQDPLAGEPGANARVPTAAA